jgi:hypothetical protein
MLYILWLLLLVVVVVEEHIKNPVILRSHSSAKNLEECNVFVVNNTSFVIKNNHLRSKHKFQTG